MLFSYLALQITNSDAIMQYIFVVNGRKDKAPVLEKVQSAISSLGFEINKEIYVTTGAGDATRFVNIHCDLFSKDEICFVACGGAGIANEVASGLVGKKDKYMAIFHCDGTNDFCKIYPDKDFTDLNAVLTGEKMQIDVIQANDNYAINVINAGFDAHAAANGNENILEGKKNPYGKGVASALFLHRINKIKIAIDGQYIGRRIIQQAMFANGQVYGGVFRCAPDADPQDGLMDIGVIRPMILPVFLYFLSKFKTGTHLKNKFCQRQIICFKQGRHVEMWAKELIYLCLDGEIIASSHFNIDILDKALTLIVPKSI